MHELKQVAGKPGRNANAFATLLVAAFMAAGGIALAQAQRTGGPTPSGQGAEVYFIDLKDGATGIWASLPRARIARIRVTITS
jgi:hypothetical protein